MSKLSGQRKLRSRYKAAAFCAVAGILLMFLALRSNIKDYLGLKQIDQRGGQAYSRLWFDSRDMLAGAVQQGTSLRVDRWGAGGVETWNAEMFSPGTKWSIAPDFSRIAWIAGTTLYWQTLAHGVLIEAKRATSSARLPKAPHVLALNMLSDGSVTIAFSDAIFRRWDVTGKFLSDWRTALKSADQAVADQDYLAISSIRERRILLYRFRDKEGWNLEDQSTSPDPPFQLVLPAQGVMATLSADGLRLDGMTWNSPGPVRSVVKHGSAVIATGDFDQVLTLTSQRDKGESYSLGPAAPGTLLAANNSQLAVSGPSGTTLFNLQTENHLPAKGQEMAVGSGTLLLEAVVLSCWTLILTGLRRLTGRSFFRGEPPNPLQFPSPPPDLITSCATGRSALWAGAGLSAQSGLPLRSKFVASLIQTASIERLVSLEVCRELTGWCGKGHAENALNGLIKAARRSDMISYFRRSFYRRVSPSRCHNLLARVPFASVMTTNYDSLLQESGASWSAAPATLKSEYSAGFPHRARLLKLYGDLDNFDTVLLSRAEFQSALNNSAAKNDIRRVLHEHTVLFIGCSLDGLLADLKALGADATGRMKHYVLTGVAGNSWRSCAAELKRRFGIEVLACDVETVPRALIEFLENLLQAVEQRRRHLAPAAAALKSHTRGAG
jgi:hypothetical protein